MKLLREGDTLVVWKLGWPGSSVKHPVNLVGELHQLGVQFKSLSDAIDTGTESKIISAKKLLASGVSPRDVAGNLGVFVPTLYR